MSTVREPARWSARALAERPSAAKAWLRALELTAPIAKRPDRILPTVIDELADRFGDAPALIGEGESLSYRSLAQRSAQYARWAIDQGIRNSNVAQNIDNRPATAIDARDADLGWLLRGENRLRRDVLRVPPLTRRAGQGDQQHNGGTAQSNGMTVSRHGGS